MNGQQSELKAEERRRRLTFPALHLPLLFHWWVRGEWVGNHGVLGTLPEDGIQEDCNEKRRLTLAHVLSFAAINVLLRLM
jgi:hypothetical protein